MKKIIGTNNIILTFTKLKDYSRLIITLSNETILHFIRNSQI